MRAGSTAQKASTGIDAAWHRRLSHLLMMASGFAGLGYQIVWTQQSALWLGHEAAAMLAVVAAFFGGIAVGALVLGQRIEHSDRPVRWYAGCEIIIALWSLLLALAMAPFGAWLVNIIGVQPSPPWQWTAAFLGTFLLLLPATAAMGATLPAMERLTSGINGSAINSAKERSIATLYASNTFGAVIGVLTIAFWLIPQFGLLRTAGFCIALNILCGASSLLLFAPQSKPTHTATQHNGDEVRHALLRLAATGLLGIGYEVLVVRVLSQVAEDTVYTFAMLLAVYLIGSAAGAAAYQRWLIKRGNNKSADEFLLCALALACLVGSASLWGAEHAKAVTLTLFGASMSSALIAEAMLAVLAFGLPTFVMGAVFSNLSARVSAHGGSFGQALGVNTLGASAAPIVFGVLAFPLLGPKIALLLIAVGYLLLAGKRAWIKPIGWLPAGAAVALALLTPPLAFIEIPEGGSVISYREGVMAAVSVVEDADGVARLRIDNRQQEGSSATLRVDARQALLPLLLYPAPQRALFLGLGTGITASSAAQHPTLQVDAVELLPEVIAASHHFTRAFYDADFKSNPRLHLIAADARRYVKTSTQHYDVIISDNFHPARSGSGSLYTVEHFAAVRERLSTDGVFCQWLPVHQLDLQTLRNIVQSFIKVYPHGWAMIASNSLETPVLGLVGRRDNNRFDMDMLKQRLADNVLHTQLNAVGIEDEFALLGSFIAGPAALKHFAGDAAANTDDFPIVAYRAPRITYMPDSLPRERLFDLLRQVDVKADELVESTTSAENLQRLAAYWQARNRFIESGRGVQPSQDVHNILAQVHEPLLAVLHTSPDFRPAYDPLLMMAQSLAQIDVDSARTLLIELAQAQPARPEAEQLLRTIDATKSAL